MNTTNAPNTVSQALRRVKKLRGRMAELSARAAASVRYEAGKKPAFDFKATRQEIAAVRDELIRLEVAIAKANAQKTVTVDEKAITVAEAIRRLQELKAEMAWLTQLGLSSGPVRTMSERFYGELPAMPSTKEEVVFMTDLSEVERAEELEKLRDRFDRINDAVETANHKNLID